MTTFRKMTLRQQGRDGSIILRRAHQKLKRDGSPAKAAPQPSYAHLVIFPNGDYRYYNRNGVLARENVSAARDQAERRRDVRRAMTASLRDVTLGRV